MSTTLWTPMKASMILKIRPGTVKNLKNKVNEFDINRVMNEFVIKKESFISNKHGMDFYYRSCF